MPTIVPVPQDYLQKIFGYSHPSTVSPGGKVETKVLLFAHNVEEPGSMELDPDKVFRYLVLSLSIDIEHSVSCRDMKVKKDPQQVRLGLPVLQ